MADVTGPISSLPGAYHSVPNGAVCDTHPDRPAVTRVQGETDSFGSEMIDLCQECYDEYQAARKTLNGGAFLGTCGECKSTKQVPLFSYRDYDEGMSGPVYYQCAQCRTRRFEREAAELETDCRLYNQCLSSEWD